ncbi:hypothetical protein GCM10009682_52020 [Luedemannella flava]|uniref:DUF306 domain-containing protein n=1 Tax=Luedemannella flava TaxID=349316 RepID=A0ABP4YTV3_9ACTN
MADTAWRAVSVSTRRVLPGTRLTLSFGPSEGAHRPNWGDVGAGAGCNVLFGTGRMVNRRLIIPVLSSTYIFCSEARMAQERWYSALLTDRPILTWDERHLTLRHGREVIRYLRSVPTPPEGQPARASSSPARSAGAATTPGTQPGHWPGVSAWNAVSVSSRQVVQGTVLTLSFGPATEGRTNAGDVGAGAGCNDLFGDGYIEGDRLVIPVLSTSYIYCSSAHMAQEQWYSDLLTSRPQLHFDNHRLTLRHGNEVIEYQLAEPPDAAQGQPARASVAWPSAPQIWTTVSKVRSGGNESI